MENKNTSLKHRYTHQDVKIRERVRVYNGFFKLDEVTFNHKRFDGGLNQDVVREVVLRQDAVGVLLYDPHLDCLLFTEQVRIPLFGRGASPWTYEIVAGIMDKEGESKEEVIKREALEEAGVKIDKLIPIHEYYSSVGGSTEKLYLYLGLCSLDGAGGVYGVESENEDIRAFILPREEVFSLLEANVFENAASLISLLWFKQNYQKFKS